MKTMTLFLLGLLFAFPAMAQSLEREVIASGGDYFSGSNASVEMTSGEATIATLSGGSNLLTQGFHQTKLTIVALDDPAISGNLGNYDIKVFPNPVQDQLFIEIEGDLEPVRTVVTDMRGKMIWNRDALQIGMRHSLPMHQLADGMYFVRVFNSLGQPLKTFKITKSN